MKIVSSNEIPRFLLEKDTLPPLSRWWLVIGVVAVAIAGLFSLVLVVARTPSLSDFPLFAALFHQALVVHVDLSVLLWFLSIACLLWSLAVRHSPQPIPYLEQAAQLSFAAGMLAIALSPLDHRAEPLMSNYIPVLVSPVFFIGLGLVFSGVLLMLARFLTGRVWASDFSLPVNYALFAGGLIGCVAMAAFVWSYQQMPRGLAPTEYYEMLFWGGGHVLQFLHTQMLLVCWLLLAGALLPRAAFNRWMLKGMCSLGLGVALLTPLAYLLWRVDSYEQRNFFTQGMMMAGGIAPAILGLVLLPLLWRWRGLRKLGQRALWSSLLMSVVVFFYGGFLGELIRGQNVVIPAHYHGSIVGVTLGFMGVAYLLLPKLGWRDPAQWEMAYWQPYVYGGGQVMHITGLAYSGGYGVLRKTPGGMDDLAMGVKVAMGFMGLGGTIAILGGFMFVIVMASEMRRGGTVAAT